MNNDYFSSTYAEARRRFRESAHAQGATVSTYSVEAPGEDDLSIDVAILGADGTPTLVTSSGIHGVEGFFGSAVQLAQLERFDADRGIRQVLIHGLNPYGFSSIRRVNEDNVDLNRNFLTNEGEYSGAPDGYAGLNALLNPESPPRRFEPFKLKAFWNIWRSGLQTMKQAVASGQHEYPRGLFFGGQGPCQSTQIVYENCVDWIGSSEQVVHVDFHSGLGPFGTYKLLLTECVESVNMPWYTETFGPDNVEPLITPGGTAYPVSGVFGKWMQKQFEHRQYRFVGAEFGTYDVIRVLGAIRAENRAHHYGDRHSAIFIAAKDELLECFCPGSESWRTQVVESGLKIISQGVRGLRTL